MNVAVNSFVGVVEVNDRVPGTVTVFLVGRLEFIGFPDDLHAGFDVFLPWCHGEPVAHDDLVVWVVRPENLVVAEVLDDRVGECAKHTSFAYAGVVDGYWLLEACESVGTLTPCLWGGDNFLGVYECLLDVEHGLLRYGYVVYPVVGVYRFDLVQFFEVHVG